MSLASYRRNRHNKAYMKRRAKKAREWRARQKALGIIYWSSEKAKMHREMSRGVQW